MVDDKYLQDFFDISFESLFMIENGICINQNKAAEKMFGYSLEEAVGASVLDCVHPVFHEIVKKSIMKEVGNTYQALAIRKDGTTFLCEIQGKDVEYEGRTVRLTAIRDISKHIKMKEELIEAGKNFKRVFYNSFEAIAHIDKGRFIDCNDALVDMLRADSRDDIIDLGPGDLSPKYQPCGELSSEKAIRMTKLAFNKGFHRFEWVNKRFDTSTFFVEISLTAIKLNSKDILHCVLRDISKEKELVETIRESAKEARAANRSKSEFLANMSHEIRTPMNGIITATSLALMSEPKPKINEYLSAINSSASFLLNIINDILDLSKIESNKLIIEYIPFSLKTLISEIKEFIKLRVREKKLIFNLKLDQDVPDFIYGDPTRIKQILLNFLSNAVKFTENGSITLSVKLNKESSKDKFINFSVLDSGIGIPKDKIEKIFERFSQKDSSVTRTYGGTGLGLTISKKLISLMNAKLYVNSELGKGSEFAFSIKAKEANKEVRDLILEESKQVVGKARSLEKEFTVLIVEDNSINMRMIKDILERKGCLVLEAENGRLAISKYLNEKIDLILMDLQMPVMNGIEATKKIRKLENENSSSFNSRKIPIVALTANVMLEDRQIAKNVGMNDFLSKPINIAEVYRVIEKYSNEDNVIPEDLYLDDDFNYKDEDEDLDVFDCEELLEILDNNKELFEALINEFFQKLPQELKEIESLIKLKNRDALKLLSHKMKGQTLNLRFNKLASIFKKLEEGALEFKFNKLSNLFEFLKTEVENVRDTLKTGDIIV